MFGIGLSEFILVLVAALIVLGPDKLPAMARALGKAYSEFRKAGDEVKKSFAEATRQEPGADEAEQGRQGPGGREQG